MITLIKILCFINTDVIASTLKPPPLFFFLTCMLILLCMDETEGLHLFLQHCGLHVLIFSFPTHPVMCPLSVFLQRDEIQQWPFSLQHPFPFYWWPPGQTGVEGQRLSVWLFIDGKHSLMSADNKLGRRKKRRKSRLLARQRRRAAEKHFKTRGAWKD